MVEAYLRDGALADLHSHRLELWVGGQIQLVVPQQLKKTNRHGASVNSVKEASLH